jgi:catechol 2,3-dioxygenase-like lactoylglutathione lyase family enzyme
MILATDFTRCRLAAGLVMWASMLPAASRGADEPAANKPRAVFHHVHLTAPDPAAAIAWYLKHLGGEPTKVGPFDAVLSNKVNILFFKAKPGFPGSQGSSVDHLGFSYADIAAKLKELEAAGVEIVSGVEQEGPIKYAFVKDPWGTLIEVVEDPEIQGFHHIHLATTDPRPTLQWYAKAFGGEIGRFAGLIPGIRYGDVWVLAKQVAQKPAPTKGRAIDHVSWGFADLDAAAVELKKQGIEFVSGPISFGGGRIGFIEGPDGVRIELVGPGKPAEARPKKADPTSTGTWKPLFDGSSLSGWTQRGGKARYTIEGDEIVGTSVPNTPNSFLCTNNDYGDFVLELEFKVHPQLNSGVQVRSQVFDEERAVERNGKKRTIAPGRVHGYQVEIDPSERAWTGGIYDEGRRGWLDDLADNEPARKAFKPGEWNKFRIECRGDSIKTWLNDVPAADLHDGMTPRGFVALQVHGVGDKTDPRDVRWRNIRIQEIR